MKKAIAILVLSAVVGPAKAGHYLLQDLQNLQNLQNLEHPQNLENLENLENLVICWR